MSESAALEGALFFMMRTYLDSGLVTPEQASQVLQRLEERTRWYCLQHHSGDDASFKPAG